MVMVAMLGTRNRIPAICAGVASTCVLAKEVLITRGWFAGPFPPPAVLVTLSNDNQTNQPPVLP